MTTEEKILEYETIDSQLRKIHLFRCFLRTRRNSMSSVSKLPVEILSKIFSIRVSDALDSAGALEERHPFQFTHVCRYWRTVAINDPSLWTHIYTCQGPWVVEMLKRSKSLPLTLEIEHLRRQIKPQRLNLFRHLYRVQNLRITIHSTANLRHYMDSLDTAAPALVALRLKAWSPLVHYPVPSSIFGGSVPKLRRLQLIRCGM